MGGRWQTLTDPTTPGALPVAHTHSARRVRNMDNATPTCLLCFLQHTRQTSCRHCWLGYFSLQPTLSFCAPEQSCLT